jgi:AcrR family transcriptional regulator
MARPRRSEGRDTRQDILEVSLDLFADRGFSGTSMREIARGVGVRESALYHHFESKQAVFDAMRAQMGPGHVAQLLQLDVDELVGALGAKGMLRQMLELMIATFAIPREQKMFRLILQEGVRMAHQQQEPSGPLLALGRVRQRLAAVLTRLVQLQAIRPVDPATAAVMFMGPLALLRVLYLTQRPDLRALRAELDRVFELLWECIKPVEAPRRARKASTS